MKTVIITTVLLSVALVGLYKYFKLVFNVSNKDISNLLAELGKGAAYAIRR